VLLLSHEEWGIVALSLKVSGAAMLACLPLAFALAYVLARRRFPGMLLLDALVHLPLVIAFGANGPVGRLLAHTLGLTLMFRWTGAALAAAVMALPLMVRTIRLSLEAIDRRLEGAARTLGAGRWHTFRTITLPLAMPGVMAGLVLGFARSIGEFGATITFVASIPGETQTLPLAIFAALQTPGGEGEVTRLAVISVLLSLGALIASEMLVQRGIDPHNQNGRMHAF
jgi:molybdate transport system permease protein